MNKFIATFTFFFWVCSLFAQAPEKMSYQTVVRNSANALVSNQNVGIRISILQNSPTGTALYVETHNATTNANGLASIEIGNGSPASGTFSSINWSNGTFFIKSETDPNGGSNYTIIGTSQLLSVPYALHAKTASNLTNGQVFTHYIGELFGGGIIFYLWKDANGAEHGLIVDTEDLGFSQNWSNITNSSVGVNAQSTWNGLQNSNAIIAQSGHFTSAAAQCLNSTRGGQTDWYLPSADELSLLWHNRFIINKNLQSVSNSDFLSNYDYWSSTESNITSSGSGFSVYVLKFDEGSLEPSVKNNISTPLIRAIRAF